MLKENSHHIGVWLVNEASLCTLDYLIKRTKNTLLVFNEERIANETFDFYNDLFNIIVKMYERRLDSYSTFYNAISNQLDIQRLV